MKIFLQGQISLNIFLKESLPIAALQHELQQKARLSLVRKPDNVVIKKATIECADRFICKHIDRKVVDTKKHYKVEGYFFCNISTFEQVDSAELLNLANNFLEIKLGIDNFATVQSFNLELKPNFDFPKF